MNNTGADRSSSISLGRLAINFLSILSIVFLFVVLRYPIYLNPDIFFDSDDAVTLLETLNMFEGGPVFLYHEGVPHVGILFDLAALPFFWIFGKTHFAYSLPGVLFYALYLWTSYWVVKKINPAAAWITVVLLLFSSPELLVWTSRNSPHVILAFLGNLVFWYFIKAKTSRNSLAPTLFLLGLAMGLSIYNYSLSLIHIATVFLLWVLTQAEWEKWRGLLSYSMVVDYFKITANKKEILVKTLDLVMGFFFLAILFAYIWGGFGFKIAGVTLLQISDLHKPVIQLIALAALRLVLSRSWKDSIFYKVFSFMCGISPATKKLAGFGAAGFLIGFSPRLVSILTGESSRGAYGYHVDFIPTNIIRKFWIVFGDALPATFGFREPAINLFAGSEEKFLPLLNGILLIPVLALVLIASWSFLSSNGKEIARIVKLKSLEFSPNLIFLLYPLITFVLMMVTMATPIPRYLIVLHGMMVFWVALYLNDIRKRSLTVFVLLLTMWAGFYLFNGYRYYAEESLMDRWTPVQLRDPLYDVIDFCQSKDIPIAYAQFWVAYKTTVLSDRKLIVSEYEKMERVRGKKQKARVASIPGFAIITDGVKDIKRYRNFLAEQNIAYRDETLGDYHVLWNFEGPRDDLEALRSLM